MKKRRTVFVDQALRFSLDVDDETGGTFVSFPVRNEDIEYEEHYVVDAATFETYRADPRLAHDFVRRAKNRELDHLLLLKPGAKRGWPD